MNKYERRAKELMLFPDEQLAFILLNQHADLYGKCPSCGKDVDGYELSRMKHVRICQELEQDVKGRG